uniref:Non-ribosomal peptide synthetase n=1 Tax=Streptomyces sp. NRRL 30471 TaxID=996287 RepID=F2WUC6_9ACTN|nr:non-ribosomal peptide synthetase [Streptomyces sp. NRRL 30471]
MSDAYGGAVPEDEAPSQAPTDVPALVRKVWLSTLGVRRCGPDDNFFVEGGNSLLAADLVSKLRAELGLPLRLQTLLRNPTLASFTRIVADDMSAEQRLPRARRPEAPSNPL